MTMTKEDLIEVLELTLNDFEEMAAAITVSQEYLNIEPNEETLEEVKAKQTTAKKLLSLTQKRLDELADSYVRVLKLYEIFSHHEQATNQEEGANNDRQG